MLVVASDEHDPILDAANSMALDSEIRVWAPVTPARGGRFRSAPGSTEPVCLLQRLRLRAGSTIREPVLADIERNGQSAPSRQDRFDSQPAMTSMMVSILADAMLTHLALDGAQGQAPVGGFVDVTYGLEGFEMSNHRVLRVPRCPECSPTSGTDTRRSGITRSEMTTHYRDTTHFTDRTTVGQPLGHAERWAAAGTLTGIGSRRNSQPSL